MQCNCTKLLSPAAAVASCAESLQQTGAYFGGNMTTHNRRSFLKFSAAVLGAPALARSSFAQAAWPTAKPIRAIVPFSAGSTIDIIGRIVLDPLSRQLGQNIVVENRGGAGGSLGSAAVAKADPRRYTLLINAAAPSGPPLIPIFRTMRRPISPASPSSAACQTCCSSRLPRTSRHFRNWWRKQKTGA
jgi:Tripartite tricarboxylate transporter family receptor